MTNKEKHQERFLQKSRFKARAKKLHFAGDNPRTQGIVYHTRAVCSCPMCGNPRKHFGEITPQEKSDLEIFSFLFDDAIN